MYYFKTLENCNNNEKVVRKCSDWLAGNNWCRNQFRSDDDDVL